MVLSIWNTRMKIQFFPVNETSSYSLIFTYSSYYFIVILTYWQHSLLTLLQFCYILLKIYVIQFVATTLITYNIAHKLISHYSNQVYISEMQFHPEFWANGFTRTVCYMRPIIHSKSLNPDETYKIGISNLLLIIPWIAGSIVHNKCNGKHIET